MSRRARRRAEAQQRKDTPRMGKHELGYRVLGVPTGIKVLSTTERRSHDY